MTREIETWLSDSRVGNNSVVDHRSRRPVLSPLRNCADRCHVWPYWASRCKPWRQLSVSPESGRMRRGASSAEARQPRLHSVLTAYD